MPDLEKLHVVLAQLRSAVDAVEDEFGRSSLRVAADVMRNTLAADPTTLNAARVNDLAFVLGDVSTTAADLTGADAERVGPLVASLEAEIRDLAAATALPADLIAEIQALMSKLAARRAAIQRQIYVEGVPEPLPHPPEVLHGDAVALRPRLEAAGFATPSLDGLIADPSSLTFRSIGDLIDELEVVAGV